MWASVSGTAEESLTSRHRGTNVDPENTDTYLGFANAATEFASFLPTIRHLLAEPTGIKTRSDSWKWIATQVPGNARDQHWPHADRLRDIGAIFPRAFFSI